jgi:hypothetical protein
MKRKSIVALILITMLVVSISLIGCGRKYSGSGNNGNNFGTSGGVGTGDGTNGGAGTSSGTSGGVGTGGGSGAGTGSGISAGSSMGDGASGGSGIRGGSSGTGTGSGTGSGTGTGSGSVINGGSDGTMRNNVNGASGNSSAYTATNFKDDLAKAGYQLKDSANSMKNYFTGNETDYLAGNDVVRVYEYNSPKDLESDINKIAPNGLTVSGTNANYTRRPYYYRNGNSLIVYEGNEPAYTDQFKTMYGNPIIP